MFLKLGDMELYVFLLYGMSYLAIKCSIYIYILSTPSIMEGMLTVFPIYGNNILSFA